MTNIVKHFYTIFIVCCAVNVTLTTTDNKQIRIEKCDIGTNSKTFFASTLFD